MSNDLRILIKADLNKGLSINEINKSIKDIQKSDSLQKIKIKLDIDDKFTQSINKFIAAVSKMQKISTDQNRTIQQTQEVFKNLDGSIKTITTSMQKNGEVVTKTKITHDLNKKAMQDESLATAKLTQDIHKLNTAELDSIKVLRNKAGAISKFNVKSSQGYTVTSKNIGTDGQSLINSSATTNYKKQREEEQKLIKSKEELRKKILELAQVGQLSTKSLQDLARGTNQSKNITDIQLVIDRYNELKKVSAELATNQSRQYQSNKAQMERQQKAAESLLKTQRAAETQVTNLIRRFGTNIDSAGLNGLLTQLKNLNVSSANYKSEASRLRHEINQIGASAKTAAGHTLSLGSALKTALTKFPIWMLSASIFYAPIRALQDMTQTIIEVDSQMTQLKRVMDQDTNFDNMLKNSIELSTQLGRSINETLESMNGFARQGFDEIESTNLARTSLLLQNISELTPNESVDALTSAMIVFNIESSKSIEIANKLNEIDNNYAVTTQDLAISMQKASSSAKTFGVSLEELLGHSTAVMSVTRESGAIVGNSLKSIYSRLTTMAESETILKSVGVSIKDMSGEVLGANDILSNLHSRWSSLTDAQRQNIGVTVAGRFQLNRFLALMDNWDIALASTETALNSQGSAVRENSKYLQSLDARIARMKSGWEQLSLAFGEAVITDTLITLISVGTSLVGLFTKVTESVGALPVLFGVVAVATYALSTSFKILITSTTQAVAGILGIPLATTSASTGVWSLSAALKALNFSIKGLLASTLVGLGFVAIGFAAEFLMKKLGDANREVDDSVESLTSLGDKVSEITHLNELADGYSDLAKKVSLSTEEKVRLSSIESDLQTKYGLSLAALDEEGKGYESNNELIKQKITLLQEELRLKNESASRDFRSNETALNDDAKQSKSEADALAESLKKAKDAQEKFIQARESGGTIDNRKGQFLDSDFLKFKFDPEDNNYDEWIQAMGERIAAAVDEAQGKFDESNNKYQQSINSISQALRGEFQNYLDVLEGSGTKVESTTRNLFDALASLSAESGNTKFSTDELNKIFEIFNSSTIKSVEDAKSAFSNLPKPLELTAEQLSAIDLALKKAQFGTYSDGTEMAMEGTESLVETQEDLIRATEEAKSSLKEINQAIYDVSEGESLNAEAVDELVTAYPELADHIIKTADGWSIEKDALELVREAKLELLETSRLAEEGISAAVYNELQNRLANYGIELDAIKTLAEAKAAAENIGKQAGIGVHSLYASPEVTDTIVQLSRIGEIRDKFNKLSADPHYGVSTKKEKKPKPDKPPKDDPKFQDATEAQINRINKLAEDQAKLNEELKARSDEFASDNNYTEAVKKTTTLIASQTKETKLLEGANKQLLDARSKLQSKSKHVMKDWIDENGEATEAYLKLYNAMGSGSAQDALQTQFDQYSKLTMAIRENKLSIIEVNKAIAENKDLMREFGKTMASDLIEAQKQIDEFALNQKEKKLEAFKEEAEARIESYQAEIDAMEKQQAEQDELIERSKRLTELSNATQVAAILQSDTLTTISDQLSEQLDLEDKKREAMQKQNDILKQRELITNIQKEKNKRLFQNGQFDWVADPQQVREEQEKLVEMETDLNNWKSDNLREALDNLNQQQQDYNDWQKEQEQKHQRELIEAKIQAEQDEIARREEVFAQEREYFDHHYSDMDYLARVALEQLKSTYKNKWDEILKVLGEKVATATSMYAKLNGQEYNATESGYKSSGLNLSSSLISKMQANSEAWNSATPANKKKLAQANQDIAKKLQAQGLNPKFDPKTGKWNILQYHTGLQEGIVGSNQPIASWLSKFGLKNNEKIAKLLNGEMVIKDPINMVQNFMTGINGVNSILDSLKGKQTATAGAPTEIYNFSNITVQTNDASQFIQNLKNLAKNK